MPGANYIVTNNVVRPAEDYNGELHIPLVVSDGNQLSEEYLATIYVITGIEESSASCKIFPNPTSTKINFTMTQDVKSILIRDLAGRKVSLYEIFERTAETYSIDVSQLPQGIYFVELNGASKDVQRFVKY
jgi:hypothetical protein